MNAKLIAEAAEKIAEAQKILNQLAQIFADANPEDDDNEAAKHALACQRAGSYLEEVADQYASEE